MLPGTYNHSTAVVPPPAPYTRPLRRRCTVSVEKLAVRRIIIRPHTYRQLTPLQRYVDISTSHARRQSNPFQNLPDKRGSPVTVFKRRPRLQPDLSPYILFTLSSPHTQETCIIPSRTCELHLILTLPHLHSKAENPGRTH